MNLYNNYMQKKCASQDIFNKFGSEIGRDDTLHETVKPCGFEPANEQKGQYRMQRPGTAQ